VPGFAPFYGTSAATPAAAGVATLIRAADPALGPDAVATILQSPSNTIDCLAPGRPDVDCGFGFIQANAAVRDTFLRVLQRLAITSAAIKKKKHRAGFAFTASNPFTTYQCALKRPKKHGKKKRKLAFNSCASPASYKHLKKGSYVFEVRGVNPAGTGPAVTRRFRIK
jgi:hypothetical protein